MSGHVARLGEGRGVYRVLVGKPEGKRPRRSWEDNIKMDLQEVGFGVMDWFELAQDSERWRALVWARALAALPPPPPPTEGFPGLSTDVVAMGCWYTWCNMNFMQRTQNAFFLVFWGGHLV
jgi:hypothetical protein